MTTTLTQALITRSSTLVRGGVEVVFPPIGFCFALSCCGSLLPGPTEFGAVSPDAVHDHGQPARQCDDRLFHPAAPGDLHRPGLEPGPLCRAHQQDLRRLVEHDPHHLVAAF
jgi:hypothetical protein